MSKYLTLIRLENACRDLRSYGEEVAQYEGPRYAHALNIAVRAGWVKAGPALPESLG